MKPYFVWMLGFGLMLNGLLSFPLISLAEEGKWTKKADMPTARMGLSTSVVNRKIYAIGGISEGGKAPLSVVEEYDPVMDKWTKKTPMLNARSQLSTSVVNGKIYVIGGWGPVKPSPVEEYDQVTDKWVRKARMKFPRCCSSTSAVNGKIYVIGGNGDGIIPTTEEYDPITDKWTKKADMSTPRVNLSTSVVNGKIYAIGGNVLIGNMIKALSVVEEYDPVTDTWARKTDMRTARYVFSTSVVNGKIYAIGGSSGGARDALPGSLSSVEVYDPVTDTWTKTADMPTARGGLSSSAVDGKIYAIGGGKGALGFSTVEEYDTGFVPSQSVNAAGKLPTLWGKLKAGD